MLLLLENYIVGALFLCFEGRYVYYIMTNYIKRLPYYDENSLEPEEYSRIYGGELSERDFDTSRPNPYNIDRTASNIRQYMKYKNKGI